MQTALAAATPNVAERVHEAPMAGRRRPLLRGVSHMLATFGSLGSTAVLLEVAASERAMIASTVYGISLVILFGISGFYHARHWSPGPLEWLRRIDHSAVLILIAGCYTPICMVGLSQESGTMLLRAVWVGAVLGVARAVFWPRAPRWLIVGPYVVVGWFITPFLPELVHNIGFRNVAMTFLGGVIYTYGAVVYTKRWFNYWPRWFGYHEAMHLLVIGAAACHYAMIYDVVSRG